MYQSKVTVSIARPRGDVFAYVADMRNRVEWHEDVMYAELLTSEPVRVGTVVCTRLRALGREYEYEWRVTEHEPPRRVVMESVAGRHPSSHEYDLAEVEGATELTVTVTVRLAGPLRIVRPAIAGRTQRGLERDVANVKELMEDGAEGPSAG
jgi:uncharacterized protein YndB with AHSA1/START domain